MENKAPKGVSQLRAVEIMNRADLFKSLNSDEKRVIAGMPGFFRAVHKNQEFIKAGNNDRCIYVLLSGKASVAKDGVIVGHLEAGDFVGEVAFITREPRTASVIATEDLILLRVDADKFHKLPGRIREMIKDQIIVGLEKRLNKQNEELSRYRAKEKPTLP